LPEPNNFVPIEKNMFEELKQKAYRTIGVQVLSQK
jgi:hypothetical protein